MSDTPSEVPRRRFAPVPIETTYESVRKAPKTEPGGHMPELTPEPSPRNLSPSPAKAQRRQIREKRRFAPQLIETSRRSRRVGDAGPATRPTDKTDITPYTNHIYVHRNKSRRKAAEPDASQSREELQQPKGARRESEDENAGDRMLEWAAKEAERQIQEAALAAFPNSRAREGGAAHFYFRESSEDDTTSSTLSPPAPGHLAKQRGGLGHPRLIRRKSSDLGYWHKHMQEHAEKLAAERGEAAPGAGDRMDEDTGKDKEKGLEAQDDDVPMEDADLDKMELEGPPDPLWERTSGQPSGHASGHASGQPSSRSSIPGPKGPIGETYMPLVGADTQGTRDARMADVTPPSAAPPPSSGPGQPSGPASAAKAAMPSFLSPAQLQKAAGMPRTPPQQIPPETGFRNFASPFQRPFGGAPREDAFRRMRKAHPPPMLGKDLTFRRCPSPKLTKLEPEHPFRDVNFLKETNRDTTGRQGLWRGYCYRGSNDEDDDDLLLSPSHRGPRMIATPLPPSSPGDPFEEAFGKHSSSSSSAAATTTATEDANGLLSTAEHRPRSGEAKGIHMLQSLEERLRREKAIAEREEKIASEFDDAFVTQVYNYLSLGYPATARDYDEELSKISRMRIEDLEQDDEKQMANGHIIEEQARDVPVEQRCPRWLALKSYIFEWARQHPDLDNLDPRAWGMHERRGSWAI